MADDHPLRKVFGTRRYRDGSCLLALHGKTLPEDLGYELVRLCILRGIRHHPGFGLECRGLDTRFTRALNTRAIMSNTVPDMPGEEDYPYCFWYPDIASEDTYRALAARYPALKYLVGRACAVAGYSTLFHELNLLPEVHIAEEAQDNGCMDILESIIAAARKYSTMDDYTRSLHDPIPATLNCDTSVRSQLTWRQKCREPSTYHDIGGLANEDIGQFNITEDFNVDDHDTRPPLAKCDVRSLLLQPLPIDLPPVRKDVLILSAAYDGNIDRYDRLRRPRMPDLLRDWHIRSAIRARHIMSNDISVVSENMDPWETPYCIWYMSVPAPQIYFALSKKAPQMIDSVLRACIVADYQDLFAALVSTSHPLLLKEAQDSPNPFYMKLLSSLEPHVGPADSTLYKKGKVPTRVRVSEPSALTFVKDVADGDANWEFTHLIYDGIGCNFGAVHLNLILPDTVRSDKRLTDEPKIGLTDFYYDVDYNPWDDYTRHLHGEPPSKGG